MRLKVLGCDGGRGLGYHNTSLLFNDTLLIDAGTIQSKLTLEEAVKIDTLFFTHAHLDHIIDLPFFLDATFERRRHPLNIYGLPQSLETIRKHIFNDEIWPDFSRLPTPDAGQCRWLPITPRKSYLASGLKVTPFSVQHSVPTVGYKIEDAHAAVIFSSDTGPTDALWQIANETDNLAAIIIDVSFPVSEQYIADVSKHMTVDNLTQELKKLKKDCDIYAFSFKVGMAQMLAGQVQKVLHYGKPVKALRDYPELVF